jgi:hypothetical protein
MPTAARVIHSDPDILEGIPVFVGTRVANVNVASLIWVSSDCLLKVFSVSLNHPLIPKIALFLSSL